MLPGSGWRFGGRGRNTIPWAPPRGTKSNAVECSTEISISFSSSSENDAIPAKETESFPPPLYGTVSAEQGFWSESGGGEESYDFYGV